MPKKYTYEDVKEYIESKGCKLLSNEYINNSKKLEIECSCGNVYNRSFGNFKNQKQYDCDECRNNKKSKHFALDIEYIKTYIENNSNCKLVSNNYKNYQTNLLLECECGNKFATTFGNFKQGKNMCNDCSYENKSNRMRLSIVQVEEILKNNNLKLEGNQTYINNNSHLTLIDENGYKIYIKFSNVNKTKYYNPFSKYNPYTIENIKKYLKENTDGYILLSDNYKSSRSKLKLQCKNNHIFYLSWNEIRDGRTCKFCNNNNSIGEKFIYNYLTNLFINFIYQHKFDDCRFKNPLPFDFAIFDNNNNLLLLIEYDGIQHYEPVTFGGISKERANENYKKQKIKDKIKNEYCEKNNIKLIRIPYWEVGYIEKILTTQLRNFSLIK